MLTLSPALRNDLWKRTDWSQRIRERAETVNGTESSFDTPEEAAEWALAAECVVPDRTVAIKLYTFAWTARPTLAWLHRARSIALEIGDFERVAELAGLEYERTPTPSLMSIQGLAYLDADLPDLALEPLSQAVRLDVTDTHLSVLLAACEGRFDNLAEILQELDDRAVAETEPILCSILMLNAARLARMYSGGVEAEPYLVRAFNFNPGNEIVFSLLENWWIERQNWTQLSETYRTRTAHLSADGRDIDAYRRAGTRLARGGSLPGLGVRLLQEGIRLVYTREPEDADDLIAMLRLLIEQLVEGGGMAAAVRLLAQALAHPRSDDEVMWIVNVGIKLAADDLAMQRTKVTFETLRNRLVVALPDEDSQDLAFDEIDGEMVDWIEEEQLEVIGSEMSELTRSSDVSSEVAIRIQMVADVNLTIRAKRDGSLRIVEAVTRDLSESGLFLTSAEELQIGDELELTLLLPGEDDWTLIEHEIKGVVARIVGEKGYGIRYTEVSEEFALGLRSLATN